MTTIHKFEDLDVWQNARKLINLVYDLSDQGEFARDFGLRDQMRRAAVSVMSNVAEGFESQTDQTFAKYLGYAKASAGEVRSQTYIAYDRKYVSKEIFDSVISLATLCSKQISNFSRYLKTNPKARQIREGRVNYEVDALKTRLSDF